MIRVLIAEDQALVRGALAALLGLEGDIEVVAEAGRGDEVVPRALEVDPDVALLDIEMPGLDGLAAAAQLRRALPACRVLVADDLRPPGLPPQGHGGGRTGFLLKDAPATELASAIRRAAAGGRVVDPALALEALSEGSNPLSEREREMLAATIEAATIADIAKRLSLSEGTVRNHLSAAIQKVGARNRAEAARIALEKGWIGPIGEADFGRPTPGRRSRRCSCRRARGILQPCAACTTQRAATKVCCVWPRRGTHESWPTRSLATPSATASVPTIPVG